MPLTGVLRSPFVTEDPDVRELPAQRREETEAEIQIGFEIGCQLSWKTLWTSTMRRQRNGTDVFPVAL